MSYLEGVVYDPPSSGYPPLIVIFRADGEILNRFAGASGKSASFAKKARNRKLKSKRSSQPYSVS